MGLLKYYRHVSLKGYLRNKIKVMEWIGHKDVQLYIIADTACIYHQDLLSPNLFTIVTLYYNYRGLSSIDWDTIYGIGCYFTTYGTSYCYWTRAAAALCITACYKSVACYNSLHEKLHHFKRKLNSTNCHFTIVPAALCH